MCQESHRLSHLPATKDIKLLEGVRFGIMHWEAEAGGTGGLKLVLTTCQVQGQLWATYDTDGS